MVFLVDQINITFCAAADGTDDRVPRLLVISAQPCTVQLALATAYLPLLNPSKMCRFLYSSRITRSFKLVLRFIDLRVPTAAPGFKLF
ncbi:hypothetical protein M758_9G009500 [Ceratodon purpureus]|uniref:Uncharacterized protein n=1 Tax=Ceratodon purpureus TaxID=3225 RepID=A0A8T0GR29_CERPU|nr:hypothetical protein KC19_9G010000 [Ceratodon purpureus]KAG0604812.1 hypothetical protein M758_9G009500 [Ceratodon purpureus]